MDRLGEQQRGTFEHGQMGCLSRRRSENPEVQVAANLEDSEDRLKKVAEGSAADES